MSSRRELERLLKGLFAAPLAPDTRPFEALQPPASALEAIETYVAACTSPSEVQRIADCALDICTYVARHATAEVTAKDPPYGRFSAWLICLEPLVLAECFSLSEVHAHLWPTVLRRALMADEHGAPVHRDAIAGVKRMLRETWRRSAELRPDAFTAALQPLELEVVEAFAKASVAPPGASADRAAGNLEDVLIALGKIQPKSFFATIAQAIATKPAQRTPMIRLLSAFLRLQGQLAHHTIDAGIHEQLLLCVLLDSDVVVVSCVTLHAALLTPTAARCSP